METSNYKIPFGILGIISAIGIVYGDIGTSPLYVMKSILAGLPAGEWSNPEYIIGAVSCIIWTLTLQTTLKYVIITLKADNKGEGGILSLYALIRRKYRWTYIIAIIGAATLLADGAITPAITIITAIEGLNTLYPIIPVVPLTILIILILFFIQPFGTSTLGKYFGPIMVIWFTTMGLLGLIRLLPNLSVLVAFNPIYAIKFILHAPHALIILGAVFMCTTGAEALYSDLGHCGLKNIRISWIYVKCMLLASYLGQAVWIIDNPNLNYPNINPFFMMMPEWFRLTGIILSTIAAFVACQALISGAFTIISEAMSLDLWPNVRILYPTRVKGQMFIPSINLILLVLCLIMVIGFRSSANLEAAYGLAITLTMLMTTILLFFYSLRNHKPYWYSIPLTLFFITIETGFLFANGQKFMNGGYASILIASVLGSIMYSWYSGRKIKREHTYYDRLDDEYLLRIKIMSEDETITKTATHLTYLTSSQARHAIESKITYSLFGKTPKRADTYWFVTVNRTDDPFAFNYHVKILIPEKAFRITINLGFKVDVHIDQYVQLIANNLEKQGLVDLSSRYPSMQRKRGDFLFVIVERIVRNIEIYYLKRPALALYSLIKRTCTSDTETFDIDPTIAMMEYVPIVNYEYEKDTETLNLLVEQSEQTDTEQHT